MSMKRLAVLAKIMVVVLCVCGMASPSWAEIKIELETKAKVGIWAQTWFQWVEDGKGDEDLNDFILRRAYMYLKGQVTDDVSFFTHLASDKVGMDTSTGPVDSPGKGLGSGVAWRDLWITVNLHEHLKIQMGRMYVPLTRNYGTTSTKCMLTADLPFLQGGSRGKIFYAQKVGRDDGVTLWGNPLDGLLQYRFMISEGVESDTDNPEDSLRFVGRIAASLLEPEKGWFNKGTYIGKKKVLSLGFGLDSQESLTLNGLEDQDNLVWTADVFFDHPVGEGAVTVEGAYIDIDNCTQDQNAYTQLMAGDDTKNWYINAGYLLPGSVGPGRLQPYVRYETVDVDQRGEIQDYETDFWSGGINYYLKGHNCKLTADYMRVDPDDDDRDDQDIFIFQITVGF
jgi:hypothetical protein